MRAIDDNAIRRRMAYQHDSVPVVLMWSEKAGCTSLLQWFLSHTGELEEARAYSDWIHDWELDVMKARPDYVDRLRARIEDGAPVYKLVRDPYARAVSSYLMLHALPDDSDHFSVPIRNAIRARTYGDPDVPYSVSFLDTLHWMAEQPPHSLESHLGPQVVELEQQLDDVRIIKLERFNDEIQRIEAEFGLEPSDLAAVTYSTHHTARSDTSLFPEAVVRLQPPIASGPDYRLPPTSSFYTPESIELIERIFAVDIAAYDYPRPNVSVWRSALSAPRPVLASPTATNVGDVDDIDRDGDAVHPAPSPIIALDVGDRAGAELHAIVDAHVCETERVSFGPDVAADIVDWSARTQDDRDGVRALVGLVPYGLASSWTDAALTIVNLADPATSLGEIWSEAYWDPFDPLGAVILRTSGGPARRNPLAFVEALFAAPEAWRLDNPLVRLLSGVWNTVAVGALGDSQMQQALRNLRSPSTVIGLADRPEIARRSLGDQLGWELAERSTGRGGRDAGQDDTGQDDAGQDDTGQGDAGQADVTRDGGNELATDRSVAAFAVSGLDAAMSTAVHIELVARNRLDAALYRAAVEVVGGALCGSPASTERA